MHVLNNFLAFGLALAYSDMASALNPTGGTLVEHPGDAHPVGGLPRAGRRSSPGAMGLVGPPRTQPFWPPPEGLCIVSPRLSA